jgi:hypothetical protein
MDTQLLQLADLYSEDERVPRATVPHYPSRHAATQFGNWVRRILRRRRGYQRLQ